jgi:3-oxoacyl-[acyl-carrier protein] reductase
VAVIDQDPDGAARVAEHGAAYFAADALDEAQVSVAVDEATAQLGGLHALVNCIGLIHSEPLVNLLAGERRRHRMDSWYSVLNANLSTAFLLCSIVAERMALSRTRGVIVNLSSVAASGNAGQSAYSAAKAGLEALTVVWAKELGLFGIRVVAVSPGFVDTPSMHTAISQQLVKDLIARTPLRRLATTEAISGAVLFAIENDFLTGRTVHVDGGLSL